MSKNSWGFTLPESVLKTQEILSGLTASALAMSDAWKAAVPHYDFSGAYAAMNAYLDSFESISRQAAQMSSLAKTILPLIDTSVFDTLKYASAATQALQDVNWGWVVNAYAEAFKSKNDDNQEFSENIAEESLTPEVRAEIAADITEVLAEPETMQLTARNKYLEWVKKNPALAIQFVTLLFVFIQTICMLVQTWQARPVKDSQVYQEPTSTSNVVYNLTVEHNVTIIGDAPYFYEAEFVNPETGEKLVGYIYKANVIAVENEEVKEQEETVGAEVSETTEATENQVNPTE